LRDNLVAASRFALHTQPSTLEELFVDPQLLFCVHRNAVSNAVKYGCTVSPITTELVHADGKLTLRVTNLPGPKHAELRSLASAECVFERGRRLHATSTTETHEKNERISAGDGGWIMKQCARALGGECSIRFNELDTVFELTFPAQTRAEIEQRAGGAAMPKTFSLPDDTLCIGIDDSLVQRTIIKKIFAAVGVHPSNVLMYGENDDQIIHIAARIVDAVRAHPRKRIFVIGDENLDLCSGCAATTVHCSAAFGEVPIEYLEFNTFGAYVGEQTPLWVTEVPE